MVAPNFLADLFLRICGDFFTVIGGVLRWTAIWNADGIAQWWVQQYATRHTSSDSVKKDRPSDRAVGIYRAGPNMGPDGSDMESIRSN